MSRAAFASQSDEKSAIGSLLWGTPLRAKIFAGALILIVWQVGVSLFAANFVAKPTNI